VDFSSSANATVYFTKKQPPSMLGQQRLPVNQKRSPPSMLVQQQEEAFLDTKASLAIVAAPTECDTAAIRRSRLELATAIASVQVICVLCVHVLCVHVAHVHMTCGDVGSHAVGLYVLKPYVDHPAQVRFMGLALLVVPFLPASNVLFPVGTRCCGEMCSERAGVFDIILAFYA
jgi:hypothetical protein